MIIKNVPISRPEIIYTGAEPITRMLPDEWDIPRQPSSDWVSGVYDFDTPVPAGAIYENGHLVVSNRDKDLSRALEGDVTTGPWGDFIRTHILIAKDEPLG